MMTSATVISSSGLAAIAAAVGALVGLTALILVSRERFLRHETTELRAALGETLEDLRRTSSAAGSIQALIQDQASSVEKVQSFVVRNAAFRRLIEGYGILFFTFAVATAVTVAISKPKVHGSALLGFWVGLGGTILGAAIASLLVMRFGARVYRRTWRIRVGPLARLRLELDPTPFVLEDPRERRLESEVTQTLSEDGWQVGSVPPLLGFDLIAKRGGESMLIVVKDVRHPRAHDIEAIADAAEPFQERASLPNVTLHVAMVFSEMSNLTPSVVQTAEQCDIELYELKPGGDLRLVTRPVHAASTGHLDQVS